jgi:hypothetical protein
LITWPYGAAAVGAALAAAASAYQGWVARDTEERQLRAYVIVKSAWFEKDEKKKEIKLAETNSAGNSALLIYYEVSNEGQTPAYEVAKRITVDYPRKDNITFDYTDGTAAYMGKQQVFGPVVTRAFTPDELNSIFAGQQPYLIFAGQITYRDIFGREWPTNFCFMNAKDWSGQVRFLFCTRRDSNDRLNYAK